MENSRVIEHPILGYIVFSSATGKSLTALSFATTPPTITPSDEPLLLKTEALLQRFLLGEPEDFKTLPVEPVGTRFQQAVWQTLCEIPWGKTRSYKWVAEQVGNPNGSRAIGQANGKNPIPLIIPCHRVIQQGGALGGYTGGLHIKSFLLSLEDNCPLQNQLVLDDYLRPTKVQAIALL